MKIHTNIYLHSTLVCVILFCLFKPKVHSHLGAYKRHLVSFELNSVYHLSNRFDAVYAPLIIAE